VEALKRAALHLWADDQVRLALITLGRLCLAALLGGVIGYERQHSHRPAGLRTHMLVAVGAALVMCTSEYVVLRMGGTDVTRMGAQVISGIGFLGAGAIVKEGVTIKGLTTAACLWTVACVGIAIGTGFYFGAILTTVIIFFILIFLRKFERLLTRDRIFHSIVIEIRNKDKAVILKDIEGVFSVFHAKTRKISDITIKDAAYIQYDFYLFGSIPKSTLTKAVGEINGVLYVQADADNGMRTETD